MARRPGSLGVAYWQMITVEAIATHKVRMAANLDAVLLR